MAVLSRHLAGLANLHPYAGDFPMAGFALLLAEIWGVRRADGKTKHGDEER